MSVSTIQVELKRIGDLPSLGDEWLALQRRADHSWFQSWSWIGCWLAELEPTARPEVLVATDRGCVVGLALMTRRRHTRRGVIVSRGFYLSETGDPRFDAVTVEYNGFLVQRDRSKEIVLGLLGYLRDNVSECDEFYLSGVGACYEDLVQDAGLTVQCQKRSPCPFVDLARLRARGGDLFSCLSSNTRSQLRRAIRRYEERGALELKAAPDVDTAMRFWEALAELHQRYWTTRGQPGAFSNPFFRALHRRLITTRHDHGDVELLRFSAGDEPLGYLYNFVCGGRVYSYQSGFRYEADNRLKVGLVAHALAIQHYLASGYGVYDFMAGDSRYKRSFATGQVELVWLVLQKPLLRFRIEDLLREMRARVSRSGAGE